MPRAPKIDPEYITKLEQRVAKARRNLQRARGAEKQQAEKTRIHVAIVVGLDMIEHAMRNPNSEIRRVAIRIVENWLAPRPTEHAAFAPLLAQWGVIVPAPEAPAASPAPDAFEVAAE